MSGPTLVLFDGDCSVCRAFARWAERHTVRGRVEFVPYQEAPTPPMTPELRTACERAVHVVESSGEVTRAGRAVLIVLREAGWPVSWLRFPPMVWAVEGGYWLVAGNRGRFGRFVKD